MKNNKQIKQKRKNEYTCMQNQLMRHEITSKKQNNK